MHEKKNIRKVVVIFFRKHFENRDFQRYGYYELRKMGFQYEAWSMADWMYDKTIEYPKRMAVNRCVINIDSKDTFDEILRNQDMKSTFFILYPSGSVDEISQYIRKQIKKRRGKFAEYSFPMSLMHEYDENLAACKNFREVSVYYLKKILSDGKKRKSIINHLLLALLYPSTFNFLQCEVAYNSLLNCYDVYRKKTILLHTMDYDDYLKCNKDKTLKVIHEKNIKNVGKYALYIDGYLMGSTDFKKSNMDVPIRKKETFCQELNHFFDMLEKQYECEVIIALHPKAEYETNLFGGRKIVEDDTALMIRDSLFCILDYSTSFDWIVLYKKPFFQIANDELLTNTYVHPIMRKYRNFGNKVLNISKKLDEEIIEKNMNDYDEERFGEYIKRYIKPVRNIEMTNMFVIGKILQKI